MQVIDLKQFYFAQTFSSRFGDAPILGFDGGAARLSTKLSTVLVDDCCGF